MFRIFAAVLFVLGLTFVQSDASDKQSESYSIRLLALKHSKVSIADQDANLVLQSVQRAASKGISIKSVGNHYINKEGKLTVSLLDCGFDLPKLKSFISEQMKINAVPGDTFLLFTVGHGQTSGSLDNLGQREGVMKAIAEAAEENQQRTLWWQLSCHATAKLPSISTLPKSQQEFLFMYASSEAKDVSAVGVQYKIMDKMFEAMAEKNPLLDQNQDGVISLKELKHFLDNNVSGRGKLVFGQDPEAAVFGQSGGLANLIPIVNRNGPPTELPKNYIPVPRK